MLLPDFHGQMNGGWLYHNSLANPLSLLFFVVAVKIMRIRWKQRNAKESTLNAQEMEPLFSREPVMFVLLGALAVTLVSLNLLNIGLVFVIFVLLVITSRVRGIAEIRSALLSVTGGSLAAFLTIATISWGIGYRFFWPKSMIDMLFWLFGSGGENDAWHEPLSTGWWFDATYLSLPIAWSALLLVFTVARGLRRTWADLRGDGNEVTQIASFLIAASLAINFLWVIAHPLGFHMIHFSYESNLMWVSVVLGVAGVIGLASEGLFDSRSKRGRKSPIISSILIPVIVAVFIIYKPVFIESNWPYPNVLSIAFSIFLLSCLAVFGRRKTQLSVYLLSLLLILIPIISRPFSSYSGGGNPCNLQLIPASTGLVSSFPRLTTLPQWTAIVADIEDRSDPESCVNQVIIGAASTMAQLGGLNGGIFTNAGLKSPLIFEEPPVTLVRIRSALQPAVENSKKVDIGGVSYLLRETWGVSDEIMLDVFDLSGGQ